MPYVIEMEYDKFVSLPPYDKNTAEAGTTYRLFKNGFFNLQTMIGYVKHIKSKYGENETYSVHKVYIVTKKGTN